MNRIERYIRKRYGILQIRRFGFWFIDIPRTSSSSIKVELSKRYGTAYGKPNLIESEHSTRRVFDGHIPAIKMREMVGARSWKRIYTFTFVRNPWDRVFSMFSYRRKIGRIGADLDFGDYVRELELHRGCRGTPFFDPAFYYGCSDYILDEDGNSLVDFIGRYETRDDDLRKIAAKIGCESLGDAWIQRASPVDVHYSTFYDTETKEIIQRLYQTDLDLFGYEFENAS